jgi:hypothetical protein
VQTDAARENRAGIPSVGSRRIIVARSDISPSFCQAWETRRKFKRGRWQMSFRSRCDKPRLVMSSIKPPAKQNRPAAAEARSGRIIARMLVTMRSSVSPSAPPML